MAGVLDVFKGDAFSVMSLTDSINKQPFVPGRAGALIDWGEEGIDTLDIVLEEIAGEIRVLTPTPRGGPGHTIAKERRTARTMRLPHYEINDAIYADEVRGVREFGSESQLRSVQNQVERRLADHVRLRLDPTLEYQRIGAIKGIVFNWDGSMLRDLFDFLDVAQPDPVNFAFKKPRPRPARSAASARKSSARSATTSIVSPSIMCTHSAATISSMILSPRKRRARST